MLRTRFLATIVALGVASVSQASILVTDWSGNLTSYNPANNTSGSINNTLAQPTGMTMGPNGNIYISNLATNTVDEYTASGTYVGNAVSSATLNSMLSPALITAGYSFQPTIARFAPGANPDLFISAQISYPGALPNSGGVYRYNMTTHAISPVVTGLTQAEGLLFNGGNLYISELNNYTGRVWKYDFVNPASVFIANGVGGLQAGIGMATGTDGMLYVADVLGQAIRRYDFNNVNNNSTVISTNLYSPIDLAFDAGYMYVANIGSGGGPDGYLSQYDFSNINSPNLAVNNLFYASAVVAVPEPTSLALLGCASLGWWVKRRRRSL